jgi:type IV pilus assembly protein PilV
MRRDVLHLQENLLLLVRAHKVVMMNMQEININKQAGFNLIEVLLAFLILSVGMLGVAGLQSTAVRASHTAMLRTVAISKVQEIAERIRSNTAAPITSYELARGGLGTSHNCDERGGGTASDCTAQELAENDLYVWRNSLTNTGLPTSGTDASVLLDNAVAPPTIEITVYWTERGEEVSYSTTIQL